MPVVTTSREHPSQVRRWWTSPRSWRTSSLLWSGSWTTTIRTMLEFGYVTNPGLRHTHIVDFNLFMCGTLDNPIAFMCGLAAFTGTGRIQNSVIWMSCPKSLLRLAVLAIPMPSQRRLQPSWPNPKVERRRRRALHMEHVHTCDSLLPKTCTKNPHSTHTPTLARYGYPAMVIQCQCLPKYEQIPHILSIVGLTPGHPRCLRQADTEDAAA
jgi:hypothetical protein